MLKQPVASHTRKNQLELLTEKQILFFLLLKSILSKLKEEHKYCWTFLRVHYDSHSFPLLYDINMALFFSSVFRAFINAVALENVFVMALSVASNRVSLKLDL